MEKQVYQQYLQKVKEQQEEREKLRKVCSYLFIHLLLFFFVLSQRF